MSTAIGSVAATAAGRAALFALPRLHFGLPPLTVLV